MLEDCVYVEMCFQACICRSVLHDIDTTEKSYRILAVSVKWNMLRCVLIFFKMLIIIQVKKRLLNFKTLFCWKELV